MGRFEKSIEVNAPVQACYDEWMKFEQFPRFMKHVKSVTRQGDFFHWVVDGPMGASIEWDAHMDGNMSDRMVSWHTIGENTVDTQGAVTFTEISPNVTRVTSTMQYEPPAGALGELVAKIFSDPASMVQQDLENFRDMMENQRSAYTPTLGNSDIAGLEGRGLMNDTPKGHGFVDAGATAGSTSGYTSI
jgi:uncharacterized membrane protein